MALFYINIHDGESLTDHEGEAFADVPSALSAAQAVLGEVITARTDIWSERRLVIEVLDASRNRVGSLTVIAES
jgi:hypothetical protein